MTRLNSDRTVPKHMPKGIDWDGAPLGKKPDTVIAREYGVAPAVVCNARNRRGIAPHTPWKKDVDWNTAPIGIYPDEVVAGMLNVSPPTVTRHRNQLGIPPCKATFLTPEKEGANYSEALIDLFWHEKSIPHKFQVPIGHYRADWVVWENLVVEYAGLARSPARGASYRERLDAKVKFYKELGCEVLVIWPEDIKNFKPIGFPEPSRDVISGKINWSKQPLGEMADCVLAKELGVPSGTVSRWRNIFGISPFDPPKMNWGEKPLGQVFDHVLAHQLGVSKETVRRARLARGVPSFRKVSHAF